MLQFPAPADDQAPHALAAEVAARHSMAGVVLAPLVEQERLIGYLSLESAEARIWPSEAIDLLRMVMSAFSHTVHRARVDREKRRLQEQDSGTGIAPEIRDRIFDPFFSTRGNDGTGLGLAVIFSIVEQHHGGIDVESAVGEGTSFRVFLPASDKPAPAPPIGPTAREAMPLGDGQRILLVEDEDAVNRFVTTALSTHGYEVLSAKNACHAWELFEKEEGRFDMVFSDAVLPDGNGVALIGRVLGDRPEMRTLLSSGHTDKEALLALAVERDISFLQKPYSLPDLLRTVNDVLHGTHQAVLN